MQTDALDIRAIDTARLLAVDMVELADSGHPGMPLGAAPMAYVLFTRIMKHNPRNPAWLNRDRFILSAGHGSALLYALLHLCGYDLSLDDLKGFRQWGSRTPGHPERGLTPGVETTSGPLGQGIATAVGIAIAEQHSAALMNRDNLPLIDYNTYVICSDGDLMEGISSEASSLAGHLKLGRLICLYDSNRISIEGSTALAFTEDVGARYLAYGWHVDAIDGNDPAAIEQAVLHARTITDKPSLLIATTTIGFGSPNKAGTASAHGAPLGLDEVILLKRAFGFPEAESFHVPPEVKDRFDKVREKGVANEAEWVRLREAYEKRHPDLFAQLARQLDNRLPEGWEAVLPAFGPGAEIATRLASQNVLEALTGTIPFLAGGSADLGGSCGTLVKKNIDFTAEQREGANLHFGIREHAMGAVLNGMALSGIITPYASTFLVFADYMKPALRLASLMQVHAIFIFTHDSIAVGEDGPTHQPIEQLAMLRSLPGLTVIRPADANETKAAWVEAIKRRGPVALVLSRQSLPVLKESGVLGDEGVRRGGYILADWPEGALAEERTALIIATGSEVHLALEARIMLASEGIAVRAVSMPSMELFEEQPEEWRRKVLPPEVKNRVVIEASSSFGWHKYAGERGIILGIDHFGRSAKGRVVQEAFGFTAENIATTVRKMTNANRSSP
ncbi:MAG: transketolase [Chlorobiaceae bacterium]